MTYVSAISRMAVALALFHASTGIAQAVPAAPASQPENAKAGLPSGLDANGHLAAVAAGQGDGFSFTRLESGIQIRVAGITKNILFYGPETVRVNSNLGRSFWTAPSIVVVGKPHAVPFRVEDGATVLTLSSARLQLRVDKRTGAISFLDASGKLYTREDQARPQDVRQISVADAASYEVANRFTLKPDEAIYGFGFTGDAEVNRRNKELLLVQTNVGIIIPMMVSSERYGVLWDTYSVMRFKDDAQGASLSAESAPGGVDYYFMGGTTMDDVVRDYRQLTGDAPMYPKQAFGLFMSKERYKTQDQLVDVARTFRKEEFPLDYIVQDWQYWGSDKDGTWSGMIWNPERYPDPEGMTKAIHDMHMKLMVSIWPSVGNDTPLGRELDEHGLRFAPLHWISKQARIYDAYSPLGRSIYFKHVKSGLLDKGVDALWMDGTEVEVGSASWNPMDNIRDIKSLGTNALGDFSRYLNPYTLMTTLGTYEGQRATSDKRVFTLTRSAWAGAQRTAAASWSGDIFASWKTFSEQVSGGVNVTITGNPYWTQDTGGFFVTEFPGGEHNAAYRELFARWFQFATFNPIMRVHGTNIEREPYVFKTIDPPMYKSLLDMAHLRYRLLPYIYSLGWQVTANGYTLMRALPMDFPDDRTARNINDAFLFGPSLLVHPVTHAIYHVQDPPARTVPASALVTPDGKPGLAGQYFEGENFETAKGRVVDATIDHNWPAPPLAELPPGLSSLDHFSARWDGAIVAPEDGEYELGLEGDDGYRLFADGKMLFEDWTQGAQRYRSARVMLRKGQRLAVKIEYFQGGLDHSLRFAWRTPSDLASLKQATTGADLKVATYLPAGADWYDFWNGQRFRGGQSVKREAPIDILPLYVRAGSIVPMGPIVQYATEQPDAPYDIRIYPGADAQFTLYEDDNETYRYEKGERASYVLNWNDKTRTLTVGSRQGSFPGMVQKRRLNLTLVAPDRGTGIATSPPMKVIDYDGRPARVTFP